MGKLIDLTGQRFGHLTVIERAENDKNGNSKWLCKCDCGNLSKVYGDNLRRGSTTSCGCISKENPHHTTHGQTHTRLYRIWSSMIVRASRPQSKSYKYYGGRGITVCDEWLSFDGFYKDAVALGYTDDLTIDRIDVNKGYSLDNVRFVSMKAQQNNRSNNRLVTLYGKTQTISEWAEELKIGYSTIYKRLQLGWPAEEALTIPPGGKRKK